MSKKELANVASAEVIAALEDSFPVETGFLKTQYPRLKFVSQDVTEETGKGKDKKIKVITAAGTFLAERQTDEEVENKDGQMVKAWESTDLGEEVEGIILFKRNQLRMFDESTEEYTSSPVFDTPEEIIPLFCNKKEIAKGTPAELKAKYAYTDEKTGKQKSKLEDNVILYVLIDGEVLQLNLRGSSMYSFLTYRRKVVPNTVLTRMSSTAEENGSIRWNKMSFEKIRPITAKEGEEIMQRLQEIKNEINAEKSQFRGQYTEATTVERQRVDRDFDSIPGR